MSTKKLSKANIFSPLGSRIAKIENDFSLHRVEFANKIGFSLGYLSHVVRGNRNNPSERFFKSICREFGVSKAWLLNGEGKPYQSPQNEQNVDFEGILSVHEPEIAYGTDVGARRAVPLRDQTPPSLGPAVDLLANILNSGDQVIIQALMSNLHAFSRAIEKDKQQLGRIQELEEKCQALEKRLEAVEARQTAGDLKSVAA